MSKLDVVLKVEVLRDGKRDYTNIHDVELEIEDRCRRWDPYEVGQALARALKRLILEELENK